MKNHLSYFCAISLVLQTAYSQGLFERISTQIEKSAVIALSYTQSENSLQACSFSTASIFFCPLATNDSVKLACVITAAHALRDKTSGRLYDGIIVKLNAKKTSKPAFVRIPFKNTPPHNIWWSEKGLDLAVIPIPWEMLSDIDPVTIKQDQIVTFEKFSQESITAGLLVQAICFQPEYIDALDWTAPDVMPVVRIGHIARMGFYMDSASNTLARSHVIDLHSSPGNSGAMVTTWVPTPDNHISQPRFLGIIQGFNEERGSYQEYKAPVAHHNADSHITLVNADTGRTNIVALTYKTVANPDLTFVTPVYELAEIQRQQSFLRTVAVMLEDRNRYERFESLPNAMRINK